MHGMQVDVWAVGVCMYQWVCGELPFPGASAAEVFDSITSREAVLAPGAPCSPALADVITQACPHPSSVWADHFVSIRDKPFDGQHTHGLSNHLCLDFMILQICTFMSCL